LPSVKAIAQLDLNLLKIAEALYQHQNMTRAAEHLNLTPSAVSHAIKRLRETLGDPLFTRQGASMVPTPVCRRLMPELVTALNQMRSALQSLGEFEPTQAQQIVRFAIHDALEPLFFPRVIALFQKKAPGLQLHSVKLDRELLSTQLNSGEIDFGIDVARALSQPVHHAQLASSSFCVVGGKSLVKTRKLTVGMYGQAKHITVSNRPTGKVLEDLAFAQLGFNRDIQVRCQNYQSAKAIITSHPLLLTLPTSMAESMLDDDLKMWPLPFDVPNVETHLYWHEHSQGDGLMQWMREQLLGLS
jgi:DNA-binding transcriptional LysR family regulator